MKYSGFNYLYLKTEERTKKIPFNKKTEDDINNLPKIDD